MSPGRLAYLAFHRPLGMVRKSIREGGPLEQWMTERGRRAMEQAAWEMGGELTRGERRVASEGVDGARRSGLESRAAEVGPADSVPRCSLEVHMLVGRNFWFMAVFAVASLKRELDGLLRVHFYDDGSLGADHKHVLEGLDAEVVMHSPAGIGKRLDEVLPEQKFPCLRERLRNYPNLRKLADPHAGLNGAKIVMDADVLFFARPAELVEWFRAPEGVLCATDTAESYGYSRRLMEELSGAVIPPLINVGITGLRSEDLDWEEIEFWCRELIRREKTNYYLEQALVAMICSRTRFTQLGYDRYITGPTDAQVLAGAGVMQHYVDLSKKEYFRGAWRRWIRQG